MTKHYRMELVVASPYTEWWMRKNPEAVTEAFDALRASDLALEVGNDGETPTFQIVSIESLKELNDDE